MYDSISKDYDRFVNWEGRLRVEIPFIETSLRKINPGQIKTPRVLDAGCGTGMHAIALAQSGFEMAGADISAAMINRAEANSQKAGVKVTFKTAGFGELKNAFDIQSEAEAFDALLCLGNSLPHLTTPALQREALNDMAACLRPGGLLLIQNRNFDAVLTQHARWMEPQSDRSPENDLLFLRFYDFNADGLITFNMVTLSRSRGADWTQKVDVSRLYPITQDNLIQLLDKSGFEDVKSYGNLAGDDFDLQKSGNLVVSARRKTNPNINH